MEKFTFLKLVNPYQPRSNFNEETLDDLAQSIQVQGIIQPITVRKLSEDKYQLISGERRLQSIQKSRSKSNTCLH